MTGELNCDTRFRTCLSLTCSYLDLAILVVLIQDLLLLNGDLPVLTWYLNLDFIKVKTYNNLRLTYDTQLPTLPTPLNSSN